MTSPGPRAFVVGLGALTAAGRGVAALRDALRRSARPLRPPFRLLVPEEFRLPAGEVPDFDEPPDLPRTHALALEAAREALGGRPTAPDAIVLGVTTGGIAATERLLAAAETDASRYALHGAGTVAERVARGFGCGGPVLTVATACSSGAVALAIALELIRRRYARVVLAGGVDGLSRLTWHGFRLLQLVDPAGARPLDRDRAGLTVAEGAGMLLLAAGDEPPPDALAELRGAGLTCDAFHPTRPLPGGEGARVAIERALADAGVVTGDVGYINLHGTGTTDNDAAESVAVRAVWQVLPPLSSTKGLTGHPLAAAGAIEAVIAVLAVREGLLPPTVGLEHVDPTLGLEPLRAPVERFPRIAVSNSFGFGGNNAALVLGRADERTGRRADERTSGRAGALEVVGAACLTGAGDTAATLAAFGRGEACAGMLPDEGVVRGLPPRLVRRLRRLPRIALALAQAACGTGPAATAPRSVFFGTAWGPLSETQEFLAALFASGERFASPTDFVGSVHNAPAGQIAMVHGAKGPNVTSTAGSLSFEQALFLASLLAHGDDEPMLVGGADERHATLGPLVDPLGEGDVPADGGGVLLVRRADTVTGVRVVPRLPAVATGVDPVAATFDALGGPESVRERFAAVLAVGATEGGGGAVREPADLLGRADFCGPVVDARRSLGAFPTVSATATVVAVELVRSGVLPGALAGGRDLTLDGRGILVVSLGRRPAAIEVLGPGCAS